MNRYSYSKYLIPNAFTFARLAVGLIGCLLLMYGNRIYQLGYLIYFFFITDFLDGYFARKLQAESSFGRRLDLFADLISFAFFPAFYFFILFDRSKIAIFYILAAAFVFLLRWGFYTNKEKREGKGRYFWGVPIPSVSVLIVSIILLFFEWQWSFPSVRSFGGILLLICLSGLVPVKLYQPHVQVDNKKLVLFVFVLGLFFIFNKLATFFFLMTFCYLIKAILLKGNSQSLEV